MKNVIVGKTSDNENYEISLKGNLLLVGTCGSGKSVLCKEIIKQIDDAKIALIDPKHVEYNSFKNKSNLFNEIAKTEEDIISLVNKIKNKEDNNELVVFVDEYLDIRHIKEFNELLNSNTPNVYYVLCMQYPDNKVLTKAFKDKFKNIGCMSLLNKKDYKKVYPLKKDIDLNLNGNGDYYLINDNVINRLQVVINK